MSNVGIVIFFLEKGTTIALDGFGNCVDVSQLTNASFGRPPCLKMDIGSMYSEIENIMIDICQFIKITLVVVRT